MYNQCKILLLSFLKTFFSLALRNGCVLCTERFESAVHCTPQPHGQWCAQSTAESCVRLCLYLPSGPSSALPSLPQMLAGYSPFSFLHLVAAARKLFLRGAQSLPRPRTHPQGPAALGNPPSSWWTLPSGPRTFSKTATPF